MSLRQLVRLETFDQSAVDDYDHTPGGAAGIAIEELKAAGELNDFDVAAALRERAERIYKRYGTLMLNVEGMTGAGIDRKATVRNLSSKLLYLAERDLLIDQESEASKGIDFRTIFGASNEDMERMRIVSLHDQDVDLERLYAAVGGDAFSYAEEEDEDEEPLILSKDEPKPPPESDKKK
eukprot:gene27448-4750_t